MRHHHQRRPGAAQRHAVVGLSLVLASACSNGQVVAHQLRSLPHATTTTPRPALRITPTSSPVPHRSVIGRSAQGRPLFAFTLGPAAARRRVLIVGCVHGDESAGIRLSQQLLKVAPPAATEVVVVPDTNPDGVAAGTRQNAHRVDLNRNFPYRWQPIGRPGDQQYSGTGPLSEPESRAMAALVKRVRPTVTVWFHQPVGLIDESGGVVAVERRFADLAGLPLRRMQRYPGSATSWQNTTWPGTSSFVVELPGRVSATVEAKVLAALKDLER